MIISEMSTAEMLETAACANVDYTLCYSARSKQHVCSFYADAPWAWGKDYLGECIAAGRDPICGLAVEQAFKELIGSFPERF